MATSIRKRVILFAAFALLSTSAVALADGGQQPPDNTGHPGTLPIQNSVLDLFVQALPTLTTLLF